MVQLVNALSPYRFGIGILFAMLYQLLMVVFGSEVWLKAIGGLIILMYLCLLVVQLIINTKKNKPEAVEKVWWHAGRSCMARAHHAAEQRRSTC